MTTDKHDANDLRISPGHNNPSKSTTITTGTPKKRKTYAAQARAHENPAKQAQEQKNEWQPDTRVFATHEADSAARAEDRETRDSSDSNAQSNTRGY
ncbi:MAG: hypothetical protein ABI068_16890 [Ktedonobacterales bacterium]